MKCSELFPTYSLNIGKKLTNLIKPISFGKSHKKRRSSLLLALNTPKSALVALVCLASLGQSAAAQNAPAAPLPTITPALSEPANAESSQASIETSIEAASQTPGQTAAKQASGQSHCRPGFGCVTNLPVPRFVSLKGANGNVRRGPSLTHRIDWVFTHASMPLKLTAEYENWRRIEDQEGAGGWVHYALLSGVRSALVTLDMAQLRVSPASDARVVAQAEVGVIARVLECNLDWCKISSSGERGWVEKTALWGVEPDEIID